MKKIILTFIVSLAIIFAVTAQQDKTLMKINEDYYAYNENTIKDAVHQTGFYKIVDGKMLRDGMWKHYINGELYSEAKYSNDKMVALVVDDIEYTSKDLQIIRLKRKVKELTNDSQ